MLGVDRGAGSQQQAFGLLPGLPQGVQQIADPGDVGGFIQGFAGKPPAAAAL